MSFDLVKIIENNRALAPYKEDRARLENDAVAFQGQLKQHQSDASKIFLRMDPLNSGGMFYEFKTADILYAEEVQTLSSSNGDSYRVIKIWIRKGAIALKLEPFMVADYAEAFKEMMP